MSFKVKANIFLTRKSTLKLTDSFKATFTLFSKRIFAFKGCSGKRLIGPLAYNKHNDTQYDDIQHNDT
jgi:hypothetical protein